MTNKTNGSGTTLGVREGYASMAEFWGSGTKPRRISYLAGKGLIRTFPVGRRVAATEETLREDREALQRAER